MPPSLSRLPPTHILRTHLGPEAYDLLRTRLADLHCPLTDDPAAASLFLADINSSNDAELELRACGFQMGLQELEKGKMVKVVKLRWVLSMLDPVEKTWSMDEAEAWTVWEGVVFPAANPQKRTFTEAEAPKSEEQVHVRKKRAEARAKDCESVLEGNDTTAVEEPPQNMSPEAYPREDPFPDFASELATLHLATQLLRLPAVYSPDLPLNSPYIRSLYHEWVSTPHRIQLVEEIRSSPVFTFLESLASIPYFTPSFARELYDSGLRTIEALAMEPYWGMLGRCQKAGVKWKDELRKIDETALEGIRSTISAVDTEAVIRQDDREVLVEIAPQTGGLRGLLERLEREGYVDYTLELEAAEARVLWNGEEGGRCMVSIQMHGEDVGEA